ncbi:unnamed protein product [Malus baccata var. baccata]
MISKIIHFLTVWKWRRDLSGKVWYMISMVAEFDECTNDRLYLQEGTIFPKLMTFPAYEILFLKLIKFYCRKSLSKRNGGRERIKFRIYQILCKSSMHFAAGIFCCYFKAGGGIVD